MTIVSGQPDALEDYEERSLDRIDAWMHADDGFQPAMTAYNQAPSDLPHTIVDLSGRMITARIAVRNTSRGAGRFAKALRACDTSTDPYMVGVVAMSDPALFDALMAAFASDPDATSEEAMRAALDQLTGSPEQLADEYADIIADLDVGEDDIQDLQDALSAALAEVTNEASHSSQPWPSEAELAERAWERVRLMEEWDEIDVSIGERLAEASAKLERRANDPTYTADFFEALGPENALALAETASIIAWNDMYAGIGGVPSTRTTIETVSEALATASPRLGRDYVDELVDLGLTEEHEDTNGIWFGGGRDYLELNDALPLLFTSGEFSTEFSEVIGQLGIDVLAGEDADGNEIDVDKGVGSPFFDGFDELQTAWQGRGVVLVEAAARNAGAANELLRSDRNAELLTSDQFVWRERTLSPDLETNWDLVAPAVRDLIIAGAIDFADVSPTGAREAAANVIQWSTDEGPGSAADALAPAYADILITYMGDLAHATNYTSLDDALEPIVFDGHLEIPVMTASQFAALAMIDEASISDILTRRDQIVTATALAGLDNTESDPTWERRLAAIDAILLAGLNGEQLMSAEEAQAAAEAFNENVDMGRDMFLAFLPLDRIPGPIAPLTDRGIDELTEAFLHQSTDQVDAAEHQVNVNGDYFLGSQRLLVGDAYLTLAIRDSLGGDADARQQQFIDTARTDFGDDYVDALFAIAEGDPDVELPTRTPHELARWASHVDTEIVAGMMAEQGPLLPDEAADLFP